MTSEEIIKMANELGLVIDYISEEWLLKEDRNVRKDSYSVGDCMLVRATDYLPNNGVVETPDSAHARMFYNSLIFNDAIYERIRVDNPELYEKLMSYDVTPEEKEFVETYGIYGEVCRNTSHYTINGLVGSHNANDFSGRGVIIMDPLEEHIDDPSLVGMRVEDTYFRGPVKLSKRAILVIPKDAFLSFLQDGASVSEMKNYNIVVFEGDEQDAVRTVLNGLGYNSFMVNGHGYVDGTIDSVDNEQSKMMRSIHYLSQEKGISSERHVYSSDYAEEKERRAIITETEVTDHFRYVVTNSTVSEELKDKMLKSFAYNGLHYMSKDPLVTTFIETIGLEEYSMLTRNFNLEQLAKGKSNVNVEKRSK